MIVIPKKLKAVVERYILSSDRAQELGGYFYGSESKFLAFLPSPNFSDTPRRNFKRTGSGDCFAREFGVMLGLPVVAECHTHPNGSVVSEADLGYIRSHEYPYEVVVADQGEVFRWFVVNRDLHEVGFIESDEELERMAFLFALELGVTDIGRVFLSNDDALLATTRLGRAIISLDEDAYRMYRLLKDHKYRHQFPTKTEMKRRTGLSPARIDRAIEKLDKEGLLPK